MERLKPSSRNCLSGETAYQEIIVNAINRRGKPITCRVTCTPMTDGDTIDGVILLMDDDALPAGDGIEPDTSELAGQGRPVADD